jgi:hypothetical protein
MSDIQAGKDPLATPGDPAMAASDPGMFAPMTCGENQILNHHLTSGWYKQAAVYPTLSEPWQETAAILDDLGAAWRLRWQAEHQPEAGQ